MGSLDSYKAHCTPYPIALSTDQKDTLGQMLEPVSGFFKAVDSQKIDEEHKIGDDVMAGLRELGLFGLQIPEALGGLGLNNTQYARVVEEFVFDPSIAVTLMAHQSIGLKGILLCGTEAQKAKYLPQLASGEKLAAFALTEPGTGSDAASVKTTAVPVEGGKFWEVTGQKMWISNGGIASTYTLFARTFDESGASKVTAFIANRDEHEGIFPGPPEKKLGIRGSNTCVVTFDKCRIPAENILGEPHKGFHVAMQILNNGRFGLGAATGGGIRKLMGLAADYANNRIQFGRPIASFGLIQEKFARMATDAYAVEAMAYMTTALIDGPKLDMSVEAAMVKVFGSEAMFRAINDCIQVLGGVGFGAGGAYPFERLMRDARILLIFEGTNEILRLFTALSGIQLTGASLKALQKNPLSAVGQAPTLISRMLAGKYGMAVGGMAVPGVAPTFARETEALGLALTRFNYALTTLLVRHGKDVIEQQLQLQRVADMAIDAYGCLAVLSRATAALAAAVPHAEHETVLARSFVQGALRRIHRNVDDVVAGAGANGDAETLRIATETLKAGKYLATHPLRLTSDVAAVA